MLEIDGSFGEGGGQILRTSLSLAALTGRPIRVLNIRKDRPKPGLAIQHLTALQAMARVTGGKAEGGRVGSTEIAFSPGAVAGGDFKVDVSEKQGSAGSVSLIFQALLLPLLFAKSYSTLELIGGTHVPWSPPYHYIEQVFLPTLRRMEVAAESSLLRWGWYPMGGGRMEARITPAERLQPLHLVEKGPIRRIYGLSASSGLPSHVRERQRGEALRLLSERGLSPFIKEVDAPAAGKGSFVFVQPDLTEACAGFSALGARGKRAEAVAQEACDALEDFIRAPFPVDPHLADQLVPYLALAKGESHIGIARLSRHLTTQVWLTAKFLPEARLRVEGEEGRPGALHIQGVGWKRGN